MMIGDRQRHRHLTIGLLAELPAILMLHADRVAALLGERCIIDNPRFDRPVTLDHRQHHLAHLGQHPRVRPWRVGNEMQQLLMLHRSSGRRRDRGYRPHPLGALRRQKPRPITSQRRRSIRVPDHPRQPLDIHRKPRSTVLQDLATHISPPTTELNLTKYLILISISLRPSDSVRLGVLKRVYARLRRAMAVTRRPCVGGLADYACPREGR